MKLTLLSVLILSLIEVAFPCYMVAPQIGAMGRNGP